MLVIASVTAYVCCVWQAQSQQQLPENVDSSIEIPLKRTVDLLSIPEIQLWRYFWGIHRNKGGKPLPKKGKQVTNMEADLIMKFGACSRASSAPIVVEQAKEPAPAKVATQPLHISKTESGLSAIYDFGDDSVARAGELEWQYTNPAQPGRPAYQLRPGTRGRHVFGPRSSAALALLAGVLNGKYSKIS